MDYDVISEEFKDCCSIAASSTGCYSAFGIGEDVLPRMEIAESYGEPLNRSLIAAFYDSEQQLVEYPGGRRLQLDRPTSAAPIVQPRADDQLATPVVQRLQEEISDRLVRIPRESQAALQ
jgi:hypothetical protein